MKDFAAGIESLKKGRIEAKVCAANLDEQIAAIDQKIAEADKTLGRLRDYLEKGEAVDLSGKTFSPDQLKDMADKTISARKSLSTQVEALRKSKGRLENVATNIESREKEVVEKMTILKGQLSEIDAKAVARSPSNKPPSSQATMRARIFRPSSRTFVSFPPKSTRNWPTTMRSSRGRWRTTTSRFSIRSSSRRALPVTHFPRSIKF